MKHKEKIKRNIRDLSYLPREDGMVLRQEGKPKNKSWCLGLIHNYLLN